MQYESAENMLHYERLMIPIFREELGQVGGCDEPVCQSEGRGGATEGFVGRIATPAAPYIKLASL